MIKRISSIIIILFTVIYVNIILYLNGYNLVEMGLDKARQIVSSVKNINIAAVLKLNKNPRVEYDTVKQSSPVEAKYNEQANDFNTEIQYELSDEDKERLLLAANKLSPIDQVKVNNYLEDSDEGSDKDAVSLLRDRLSDKDFENIKDISEQFNKK